MSTRQERRQARIERYRSLAANAEKQSEQAFEQSHKMSEVIPFGQPILIGHHSERADRNYRAKIWNKMDKAVKLSDKAIYFEQKAIAAENNNAIYLEDEDSIERLQEKVEQLSKYQEQMKAGNKIIRSKKLSEIEKLDQLKELGLSDETALKYMQPWYYGSKGFPSFMLTNNNARLNNAKERLAKAEKLKSAESKEYVINDIKVVENTTENRLQLFFDGKPSDEIRTELKRNAFRWSPYNCCWQSYLNRYQIDRAKTILNKIQV